MYFFSKFQICINQLLYFKTQPTRTWKLVCPIFMKLVLDIFAVCLLVPRINFFHTQPSYLCQKKSKLLTRNADLRFLLGYTLRIIKKYWYLVLFMLQIFQAAMVKISAKKYTLSIKHFSKQKWNLLIWNKCYWSYKLNHSVFLVFWNNSLKILRIC